MKVTVCFGAVRVVVPCGAGDLLVRDLIIESIRRYKKAAAKEPDSWVVVHHLQSQSGILDPDDKVSDVADDREQIIASFEDGPGPEPHLPQGGGDGASGGSSVGTGSPDIFRGTASRASDHNPKMLAFPFHSAGSELQKSKSEIIIQNGVTGDDDDHHNDYTPHIEVTEMLNDDMVSGLGLQVRRISDPSLHQSSANQEASGSSAGTHLQPPNGSGGVSLYNTSGSGGGGDAEKSKQRWSAAPVCRNTDEGTANHDLVAALYNQKILNTSSSAGNKSNNHLSPSWEHDESHHTSGASSHNLSSSFSRSGRLSMQFLGDGNGYKWMEAAERIAANGGPHTQVQTQPPPPVPSTKTLPREMKRKEPLGQAYESMREKNGEMLLIMNENGGPLGLTAIPDVANGGLLVQAVEANSRAEKGRLRRGDRILEINGTKLMGMQEASIQEYLRKSLSAPELRLRVMRDGKTPKKEARSESAVDGGGGGVTKVATISPTRKVPGAPVATSLQVANTRKLGRRIEITLRKGPQGLGFSVTTRDNPAGGQCPIYIKNILPRGAAIEDGKLKPGDRLLEVDGVLMTGKSQTEVVGILRATKPGATVHIVVSRQQELAAEGTEMEREIGSNVNNDYEGTPPKPPPPVLPQKPNKSTTGKENADQVPMKLDLVQQDSAGSDSTSSNEDGGSAYPANRNREILTLHIPVHDTEKAGLGVSVKGKTGTNPNSSVNTTTSNSSSAAKNDGDLGIFVKSVLHGGAASRDGRLKMNDQLLSVNGTSLLGQSNAEAMETLRKAMYETGGNYPGVITLTVARKVGGGRPLSMGPDGLDGVMGLSQNPGASVVYIPGDGERNSNNNAGSQKQMPFDQQRINKINNDPSGGDKRWSNPVLQRLTGGSNMNQHGRSGGAAGLTVSHGGPVNGLRNDSYYMATVDNWSPVVTANGCGHNNSLSGAANQMNNSVLIEEDPEPQSPTSPSLPIRPNQITKLIQDDLKQQQHYQRMNSSSQNSVASGDVTYSSQLSLESPPGDAFSRDALGRRSMSEKHHAAMDARETGTYQRNKRAREERERERMAQAASSDALNTSGSNKMSRAEQLRKEALGPSLGMKKSSSLESLQTMVQEIQMSDEPRGPNQLRTPRGRGREESLRAAVERPESQPRKTWLLEDGAAENDAGFSGNRNGPLQSSLNEGKHKRTTAAGGAKKPGLLKGIGHMFRFGKHRKDGIAPAETVSELGPRTQQQQKVAQQQRDQQIYETVSKRPLPPTGPPMYQPPPAPQNGGIHQTDVFNHRYAHYLNYDEMQQQIRSPIKNTRITTSTSTSICTSITASTINSIPLMNHPESSSNGTSEQQHAAVATTDMNMMNSSTASAGSTGNDNNNTSGTSDALSESTIEQMRQQVMHQRVKVEEESRRHHLYHSQRSTRTIDGSNCVPSTGSMMNGGPNKSYTISGHSRQRSQPETYSSTQQQQQHQHQSPQQQPIYAQAHPPQRRPASSYYEYEQHSQQQQQMNGSLTSGSKSQHSSPRKMSAPSPPGRPQWNGLPHLGGGNTGGGSMRGPRSSSGHNGSSSTGGPYVTQVQIQQQKHFHQSIVGGGGGGGGYGQKQAPPQMPSASKV